MSACRPRSLLLGLMLAARTGLAAGQESPSAITVPEALRTYTASIEASGIVWAPSLQRYLVVSDDIGAEDSHHEPYLLAMSRDGTLDETPVPILGVDTLNDAESICPGPDGTFFLTTSHSTNRKGKLRAERRMLLWLKLEGRTLRVNGRVDLTQARDASGRSLLEIASLDPEGRLDIEALTYREGALLIGLKSPLSARGGAVILRLDEPAAVLRSGHIPANALTRLWEVPLGTAGGEGSVLRGIADMATLPDGSLVLAANSPKGLPSDGGGALYWFKPNTGALVLLQRFPGLKPEGVTLSNDGQSLVIVFDTDKRPPVWMRWPLRGGQPT